MGDDKQRLHRQLRDWETHEIYAVGDTSSWVRGLDSLAARELTGTDGALGPVWSPDSQYVGFFARGALNKVSLIGEPPVVLCEIESLLGASGTWHRSGVILFSQPQGIYRTSSMGGVARAVTSVDRQRGDRQPHRD